jgi:hypothetical protein
MIITIKGADFSLANIGTLSTYIISKSIGSGATFDIPNFVDKNSSVNWVITLDEGYTFGTYSVSMGGNVITPTVVDNVMTISIAEVTGNVRIVVATVNENTGEEDDPVVPPVEPDEPEEPETPIGFVPLSSNWRLEKSAGKDNVRLICAENIPNNAVVNFKNASDWETYKYAISFDGDGKVGSTWVGGGYQTSAYTTTKEQVYTVMIARQDGEVFTTSDVEYIQNNMGYTL